MEAGAGDCDCVDGDEEHQFGDDYCCVEGETEIYKTHVDYA